MTQKLKKTRRGGQMEGEVKPSMASRGFSALKGLASKAKEKASAVKEKVMSQFRPDDDEFTLTDEEQRRRNAMGMGEEEDD